MSTAAKPDAKSRSWTFERLVPGTVIPLGELTVSRNDIVAFARQFDPQPFHLDEQAAKASVMGDLSASGWHTGALVMRLLCDGLLLQADTLGSPGIDRLRWLAPVFPGSRLRAQATVLAARPSASRPGVGIVTLLVEGFDQQGTPVLSLENAIMFGREATPMAGRVGPE